MTVGETFTSNSVDRAAPIGHLPVEMISNRTIAGFAESGVLWRKVKNTFLQLPWLWPLVIGEDNYRRLMKSERDSMLQRAARRFLWFWPRIVEAKLWVEGGAGQSHTVDDFRDVDESGRAVMNLVAGIIEDRDACIFDLGCNSGRHLDQLFQSGFHNLYGVDAMGAALDEFAKLFPATRRSSAIDHDLFQRHLRRQPDLAYDVSYTWGATIETVHPSFPVVAELCRLSRRYVICIINENKGLYPRFWTYEFNRAGFDLVFAMRPLRPTVSNTTVGQKRHTTSLLVYRRKNET